ncbi:MAG: hypothetical protein A2452_02175 [Candidatus Firestonebacteria bacterium RIFOXYC2_FULL_39_67]|nr:MAG: hypothetical protein A2452_02175 [Candidatus Firestonebacteria bacterium RIFOXYC2_FULL_39_67]
MRYDEVYKKILESNYYVFSFEDISSFWPEEKRSSIKQALSRWKADGRIGGLRRGLYELKYPASQNLPDMYLANRMYAPSYVSMETALSHYSLIPDVAMAVVSITPRQTKQYKNEHGLFKYHTVRPKAFNGYVIEKQSGYDVFIAEPEKALADYVYFKSFGGRVFNFKESRLDEKRVRKLNQSKLKGYFDVFNLDVKETLNDYL